MAIKKLEPAVIDYRSLRRTIGWLGLLFPFIIALGGAALFCLRVQGSLSRYYYTDMRDVFVGLLFAIGVFLTAYRGYKLKDRYIGLAAGLCAMGVALFPMPLAGCPRPNASYLHYAFATVFFILLIHFCFQEFTQTEGVFSPEKGIRNKIYRTCGCIMTWCLILMGLEAFGEYMKVMPTWVININPTFLGESISIFFFGISWLVKGDGVWFLNDKPKPQTRAKRPARPKP